MRRDLRSSMRARRGAALLLVLFLTLCIAAIATSAVLLQSSASLVTRFYDRERDFRYAAEAGLALGRSRLARDTSVRLPDSGFVKLLDSATVSDAAGNVLPRTRVTVYAGRSGNVTGQFGDFVTLVAKADDGANTRYVRRLELVAENFARFAMFTNTWQAGLCYSTGEFIRGYGWSNQQWESCGNPTYWDTVGAVLDVTGGTPTWRKGLASKKPFQAPIPMPTVSRLAALPGYAASGSLSFNAVAGRLSRIEFEAADIDGNGDSTGVNEGFLRVFRSGTDAASQARFRLDAWMTNNNTGNGQNLYAITGAAAFVDSTCGDFHGGRFYPIAVHVQGWFATQTGAADAAAAPLDDTERDRVLQSSTARCYPAGSPQLAAVERVVGASRWPGGGGGTWTATDANRGGEDTTFTPNGRWGYWERWPNAVASALTSSRRATEAPFLFPLNRSYNNGYRGVVYFNGDVWLSGQLRTRLTLYSSGSVTFLDDLTYVTPPNAPGTDCFGANANMLGIIAVNDVMIAQNVLHRPQRALRTTNGTSSVKFLSGSGPHFRLHGVLLSLTGTVGVTGFDQGPSIGGSQCLGQNFSGGCIAQVGGVIEQRISATFAGGGTGFAENREVDQCMLVTSPPYFPTTGRYFNNRYYEYDPQRFDPVVMYRTLQSGI